jgi:hypothetical protein
VAILYAEPAGAPEAPGTLELIAAIAGAMHETLRTANWASLPKAERELHLRAQRFARVQVAEMLHRKSGAVEEGRASRNIYEALREEIEAARGHFRESFIDPADSMVDYLHLEIVRTLAFDDLALLGSSYPGPLA